MLPEVRAASSGECYLHRMGRTIQCIHDVQYSGHGTCGRWRKDHPDVQEAPPASDAVQGVVPLALPTKSGLVLVGGSVKPMAFAVLFVIVTN